MNMALPEKTLFTQVKTGRGPKFADCSYWAFQPHSFRYHLCLPDLQQPESLCELKIDKSSKYILLSPSKCLRDISKLPCVVLWILDSSACLVICSVLKSVTSNSAIILGAFLTLNPTSDSVVSPFSCAFEVYPEESYFSPLPSCDLIHLPPASCSSLLILLLLPPGPLQSAFHTEVTLILLICKSEHVQALLKTPVTSHFAQNKLKIFTTVYKVLCD